MASEWIKTVESTSSYLTRENDIYPILREWVEASSPKRILEIGCGQGICSECLNLENRKYTGIDTSNLLIKRARELYKGRTFQIGKAEALPFQRCSFDSVFSVAAWNLIFDIETASDEISRVLTNEGRFLIICANPDAYPLWTKPYLHPRFEGKRFQGEINDVTEVFYLHSRKEILESLQRAGLDIQSIETFRNVGSEQQFLQIEGRKKNLLNV